MNITIINALYSWFERCELISQSAPINVDLLGEDAQQYCLEVVPCTPILQKYADGSSKNQYLFIFASREYFSEDECNNMRNLEFYEDLENWIEQQNRLGTLPQLPEEDTPLSVDVLSSGYVMDKDTKTARYQIQCCLKYIKEYKEANS